VPIITAVNGGDLIISAFSDTIQLSSDTVISGFLTVPQGGTAASPELEFGAGSGMGMYADTATINIARLGQQALRMTGASTTFYVAGVQVFTMSQATATHNTNVDMQSNVFISNLRQSSNEGTGLGDGSGGGMVKSTDAGSGAGGQFNFGAAQGGGGFQSLKGYLTDGGNNTRGRLQFTYRAVSTDTTMTRSAIVNEAGKWTFDQTIINGTSLRTNKENIEDAAWLADMVLEPVSFFHKVDGYDQFGFVADDLYAQDERTGVIDIDGDLANYDVRAVVAILAAKVNRLEQGA
jgi:hypothetical protein